jgi:endonuclease III-like uncharacterized protein
MLGTQNGGLEKSLVLDLIEYHLSKLEIKISVYNFDKDVIEDNLIKLKNYVTTSENSLFGLSEELSDRLYKQLNLSSTKRISDLMSIKGIGELTINKIYSFLLSSNNEELFNKQLDLFL